MARLQARSGARSFATRFWTASSQTTLYVFSLSTVLRQTDVTAFCMDEEIVVERAMKSCAQCHGKLGLGVRARNLWNGHWWVHVRFCSAHCEALYELERYDAKALSWRTVLARRSSGN